MKQLIQHRKHSRHRLWVVMALGLVLLSGTGAVQINSLNLERHKASSTTASTLSEQELNSRSLGDLFTQMSSTLI